MKFRLIPVHVEAVQFTEAMALGLAPLPEGVTMRRRSTFPEGDGRRLVSHFHSLDGHSAVEVGDWVVTHPNGGGREVLDTHGFAKTFEPLADVDSALFASEDAPKELLDAFRSAEKPAALAMYRLLRERVLGLPSSLPEAVDRPDLCVNCSRPESDHSHVGNLCSLGAGFTFTPWGADAKEGE